MLNSMGCELAIVQLMTAITSMMISQETSNAMLRISIGKFFRGGRKLGPEPGSSAASPTFALSSRLCFRAD